MDEQQEREIARGLREGEADAWRALYDAYAERIWRVVARLLGANSADVADVVQETFLAAARSASAYDAARGSLWFWLCGITRRHVALHYRKEKRHDRLRAAGDWLADRNGQVLRCLEGQSVAPPEVLAAAELATLVRATLTELPAEYESVLTAKYLDGESVEHIASQQRSTVTAVRSRLARARQAFRQMLLRYSVFADDKRTP
ncbi:MAG TPA: sigma-70 family RNA polymerase sigma factor [Gemmataceae bacterium]|nr:sigma-70 family RNA polymerase sigma factor [Gemmataceae bacterium]